MPMARFVAAMLTAGMAAGSAGLALGQDYPSKRKSGINDAPG
jgi:hypothetical protein